MLQLQARICHHQTMRHTSPAFLQHILAASNPLTVKWCLCINSYFENTFDKRRKKNTIDFSIESEKIFRRKIF